MSAFRAGGVCRLVARCVCFTVLLLRTNFKSLLNVVRYQGSGVVQLLLAGRKDRAAPFRDHIDIGLNFFLPTRARWGGNHQITPHHCLGSQRSVKSASSSLVYIFIFRYGIKSL